LVGGRWYCLMLVLLPWIDQAASCPAAQQQELGSPNDHAAASARNAVCIALGVGHGETETEALAFSTAMTTATATATSTAYNHSHSHSHSYSHNHRDSHSHSCSTCTAAKEHAHWGLAGRYLHTTTIVSRPIGAPACRISSAASASLLSNCPMPSTSPCESRCVCV
jgi:hypothetical protein